MADVKKGADLVAVAIANTFQSYLPGEIDNVNGAWNDVATVPALVYPKRYFSERRLEMPESPSLMVGMLGAKQSGNGAYSPQAGWGSLVYEFEVTLWIKGDKLHILERLARRYAQAMWEVVMKYQNLDGTVPGQTGVDLVEMGMNPAPFGDAAPMTLIYAIGWRGMVYVEQSV